MNNWDELFQRKEPLNEELAPYVQTVDVIGTVLRHPLIFMVPFHEQMAAYANAALASKQAAVDEAAREGDIRRFVFLHERPYRVEALATAKSLMSADPRLAWDTVKSVWTDSENVGEMAWLWERIWSGEVFGPPIREALMSKGELQHFEAAPDEIDLYRGQATRWPPGWSWTDDRETAQWFAQRTKALNDTPTRVLHLRAKKSDIAAYFASRGESEYVITNAARQRIASELRIRPARQSARAA